MAAIPNEVAGTLRVSRFTSDNGLLSKSFALDANGVVETHTAARLNSGIVENISLSKFDDFASILIALEHNQALSYGVSLRGTGPVVSEKRWASYGKPEGVLLRNRDHFDWSVGEGIWMLDYDPPKDGTPLTKDELLAVLYSILPELEHAPHFWRPSASSCIRNTSTGEEVTAIRGQRVYIHVADAQDIPRAGSVLTTRLWLAGHGRFDVSRAGSLLARTTVDASVWQPEKLDFAAGAKCEAPLVQDRDMPLRLGGHIPLDTRILTELSAAEIERVERAKGAARLAVKAKADAVKTAYSQARVKVLVSERGLSPEVAEEVVRESVESGRLMSDFPLQSEEGLEVTVGELLDNPGKWDGHRFHDPVEPEYPDERIAWVNLNSGGRPYLWSHAHGGCRYELCRAVDVVDIAAGGTALATEQTLKLMQRDGGFYERGRSVVTVTERGDVQTLGLYALKQRVERGVRYRRWDGRGKNMKPVDCPDEIARRVLDMKGSSGLPPLGGITLYPTMTMNGRLLDKPGYDSEAGLLLLNPDGRVWPKIPTNPAGKEVVEALGHLWAPFAQFPFSGATSRGVALAAILTAAVRRCLPTAPAFMFAAPSAGSGKTLLGSCVVELAGRSAPISLPDNDTEIAKVLVSLLRKAPGAIFFDNVVGTVDSKVFNAMLTAPDFDGRILGVSEMTGALPTNALVILTGNNARPVGDTCRRMLVSTIDPKVEHPYLRCFEFNPLEWVRMERMSLVVAALTILRAWMISGKERVAPGNLASFEVWDRVIRQAVIWVAQLEQNSLGAAAVGYGDPIADIQAQQAADDDTEALGDLLETWAALQDGDYKSLDLFKALDSARRGSYAGPADLAALGVALLEIMPKVQTSKGVGSWLKRKKGVVVRGLRLVGLTDNVANNTTWSVQRM